MFDPPMVVTTTTEVTGRAVSAYLGLVSSHVVAGTNLFRDVFASLSDIFGGRSESYQRELRSITNEAITGLCREARSVGGNAIIGVRIDHDEISGGGKSMLMVTATGTAVILQQPSGAEHSLGKEATGHTLTQEQLAVLVRRRRLASAAENGNLKLTKDVWEFIVGNAVHEVCTAVLVQLRTAPRDAVDEHFLRDQRNRYIAYFRSLDPPVAKSALYSSLSDDLPQASAEEMLDVITSAGLVDNERCEELIKSDSRNLALYGLRLALAGPILYMPKDIATLLRLVDVIKARFPETDQVAERKKRLSSKTEIKWACSCGKENALAEKRCRKCTRDKRGLLPSEPNVDQLIGHLQAKAHELEQYFGEV
jgi:uncharacterized protein YbjQ (UPF0145 family)